MRFKCPSCGQTVAVSDAQSGEAVQCGSCGKVLTVPKPFDKGFIIGDFCVVEHIGSGRMGEVYKAYQETLVRDVVLKVLDNDMAEHSEHILEFFKEARVAARLNHPNIVQSYSTSAAKHPTEKYYFSIVISYKTSLVTSTYTLFSIDSSNFPTVTNSAINAVGEC